MITGKFSEVLFLNNLSFQKHECSRPVHCFLAINKVLKMGHNLEVLNYNSNGSFFNLREVILVQLSGLISILKSFTELPSMGSGEGRNCGVVPHSSCACR